MKEAMNALDQLMMIACFLSAAIMFMFFPFHLAMLLGLWPVLALLNIMGRRALEKEHKKLKNDIKTLVEYGEKQTKLYDALQENYAEAAGELAKLKKEKEAAKPKRTRKPKASAESEKPVKKSTAKKPRLKPLKEMSWKEISELSKGGLQTFK